MSEHDELGSYMGWAVSTRTDYKQSVIKKALNGKKYYFFIYTRGKHEKNYENDAFCTKKLGRMQLQTFYRKNGSLDLGISTRIWFYLNMFLFYLLAMYPVF